MENFITEVKDILYSLQVVVGSKQDVDRVDLPYEEIEATVRFFLGSISWTKQFMCSHCEVTVLLGVG